MTTPRSIQDSKVPKRVLVTGAQGALGQKVVERFLQAGVHVIGTFHRKKPEMTAAPGSGRLDWIALDVTDSASVREGVAHAQAQWGAIDGLVHCAGGFRFAKLEDTSDADLDFLINTNFRSAALLLRALLPGMKQNGFGRIVLVSSRASLQGQAGMGVYAATKAGLNLLTASVAEEVRKFDININSVLPTIIDTPANRADMPQADHAAWVPAESLAEVIFNLTQPSSKSVNGALLPVAGRL